MCKYEMLKNLYGCYALQICQILWSSEKAKDKRVLVNIALLDYN